MLIDARGRAAGGGGGRRAARRGVHSCPLAIESGSVELGGEEGEYCLTPIKDWLCVSTSVSDRIETTIFS